MAAYYNEIDTNAAAWLRELIKQGHIVSGDVDERSIEDVHPDDLRGYEQCHFFAGIGGWSLALRRAGWPDTARVWTGSCPCQPFSAAGKGAGFDDERHLWPAFHWLIGQCGPRIVLGEQVASKVADTWLDLVQTDLEALGYAFGAVAFPSAGVGAPHIRDRTYWVANTTGSGRLGRGSSGEGNGPDAPRVQSERFCNVDGLADTHHAGLQGGNREHVNPGGREETSRYPRPCSVTGGVEYPRQDDVASKNSATCGLQQESGRPADIPSRPGVPSCGLANTDSNGGAAPDTGGARKAQGVQGVDRQAELGSGQPWGTSSTVCERPRSTNGFWGAADWLLCRDGKWRPVEPGTFPLAHGVPARVGRLRGYGNAINVEAAKAFIECLPFLG